MDLQSWVVAVVVAFSAGSLLRRFWVLPNANEGGCSNCSSCSSGADKACASSAGTDFAPIVFYPIKPKNP
jgi:hypothetical protein